MGNTDGVMAAQFRLILFGFLVLLLICLANVSEGKKKPDPPAVEDEYASVRDQGPQARKKSLLKNPEELWKKAAVIYKIDHGIGCPKSSRCKKIIQAMNEYSEKTCIRFKERSGEPDYVRIKEDRSVYGAIATVGRKEGESHVTFNPKSWSYKIVLHELGHTLSLVDEIRRPDRDNYIDVREWAIKKGFEHVFKKFDYDEVNLLGVPFDRKSIMVYCSDAFSMDYFGFLKTLKLKSGESLGGNGHLSPGDVKKLNDLYRCEGNQQKVKWPVDVVCDFENNDCGFTWYTGSTWKWIAREGDSGGYLESKLDHKGRSRPKYPHTWSVNFHALSPEDPFRHGEGCINFMYLLMEGRDPRERRRKMEELVSLKLFRANLRSPLDLFPKSKNYFALWPGDQKPKFDQWTWVSLRTKVDGPFMLEFRSNFNGRNNQGSARIARLEVRYAPCTNPTNSNARLYYNGGSQRLQSHGSSASRKDFPRNPSLGSYREFLRVPSSESLPRSESASTSRIPSPSYSRMSLQPSSFRYQDQPID